MNTPNQLDHVFDPRAEALVSSAYQERCELLFELFHRSREADKDPRALLAIQAELADLLIHFQNKKVEFKQEGEGNQIRRTIAKRLMLILKRIADSIAWRVFGYDRVLIQLLAEHSKTGHLDKTVFGDLARAQQIVEQEGAIVLVNDLTTTLRHGDLTIIDENGFSVVETKYGKASSRDRSAIRQKRLLNELKRFYNTGTRVQGDRRDYIFKADVPIKTHHSAIVEAIALARKGGYHRVMASDCLAIEAHWMKDEDAMFPKVRPFEGIEHTARFHNLQPFDKPASRVAPYGIFPLDHRSCFDLITGEIVLVATVNFDHLQARWNEFGLELDLPQLTKQEIETYSSASMAERKKLMHLGKFLLRDGDLCLSQTLDYFADRIGIELMHEDTIVQTDRQLMNLIKELQIPGQTIRFYTGYVDESGIWM